MAEFQPKFIPGKAVTFKVAEPVTGGRLVEVTGDREISPAGAGSTKVIGVAAQDADAGDHVAVWLAGVMPLIAASAVAVGDQVVAADNGKVATGTEGVVGIALTAAEADATTEILWK